MRFSETVKGEKSITGVPMKKRDLIAVICPCINGPVSEIIRGISSQAMTCNTDTAFFQYFQIQITKTKTGDSKKIYTV